MKQRLAEESHGLEPRVGGNFVIGLTEGVNDESAFLVEDFMLTRHELEVLARHYYETSAHAKLYCEVIQGSGSTEWRELAFAQRRLSTIETALGKEVFELAIKEVKEKWSGRLSLADHT